MLIDLIDFEKRGKEVLKNLMVPFGQPPSEIYGCPLLHWTLQKKTFVEGIIILQDWYSAADGTFKDGLSFTMKMALKYICEIDKQKEDDDTLLPLFSESSNIREDFDAKNGWLATNAVWGQRLPGEPDSETLSPERHHAGFLIWGSIVKNLIEKNPNLKIVLAGGWAARTPMDWGHDYSAAKFYKYWGRWLKYGKQTPCLPAAKMLLSQMPCCGARFYTRYHSSQWKRWYKKTPSSFQDFLSVAPFWKISH